MFAFLRHLLVIWFLRLSAGHIARNGFLYQSINNENGHGESTCVYVCLLENPVYLFAPTIVYINSMQSLKSEKI